MNVRYLSVFLRQFKKLPRHFYSVEDELYEFLKDYRPKQTETIGKSCFKIRWSPSKSGKGKSGSLRIIVLFLVVDDTLVLCQNK